MSDRDAEGCDMYCAVYGMVYINDPVRYNLLSKYFIKCISIVFQR